MPHDEPPIPPHRKPKILWWLVAVFVLLFALFASQLLGPTPSIVVSKQTTYITAPLRPDGLPDFHRYVLEKLRAGVTPENNAAVPMWQAVGPGSDRHGMTADEWQTICKELQFTPVEHPNGYLGKLYSNQRAVAAWMHKQGRLKTPQGKPSAEAVAEVLQMAWPFKIRESSKLLDVVQQEIDSTMSSPWKSEELPLLAAWLQQYDAQLDLLVEASKRPRLFSPDASFFNDSDGDLMAYWSSDIFWNTSEIAYILPSRAMWHLGEGRHREAWDNLFALFRWSRLVAQDASLTNQLRAPTLAGVGHRGVAALLEDKDLPADVARQAARDLASLGPATQFADAFEEMERIYFIHLVVIASEAGAGTFLSYFEQENEFATNVLNHVALDWNIVLKRGNLWYDRISIAFRLPNHDDRVRELTILDAELQALAQQIRSPGVWLQSAINRHRRSETIAAALITQLHIPLLQLLAIEDKANSQLHGMQLAAALAAYRAEHGNYPERLDQLVPDIIPQLPDSHIDEPFVYERTGDSYILSNSAGDPTHANGSPP